MNANGREKKEMGKVQRHEAVEEGRLVGKGHA
jgi:hypothetical protein